MVLLAPTRSALQRMIDKCSAYCHKYGLYFNAKKSKIMIFSKTSLDQSRLKPVTIDGSLVEVTDRMKYLGTTIKCDRSFSFSNEDDLRSFYRASNSVLNHLHSPNESVSMQLLYSHCVPCLSYACSIKEYPARQMIECNVALNDAIRKIFSFNRWESVRSLREGFGYSSLTEIFAKAKKKFHDSLLRHSNTTIVELTLYIQQHQSMAG